MPIRVMATGDARREADAHLFGLPGADPSVEPLPEGLSFCLIMKNEERFLERCLASVAGVADELCVVDTGSTDRSVEIARRFGARVETIAWPGDFAKARNVSLRMAKYRWILTLDADEEVTPQSLFALAEIKRAPAATTAVMCRINNVTRDDDGEESTFSHYLPRLFPNVERLRYLGAVHERLVVDGEAGAPMVDSPVTLLHYGYQADVLAERDKTNRNLPLILREAEANPDDTFCVFNLAMMQMSLDQVDESVANFERMFALAERKGERRDRAYFAPAYVTLATLYYRNLGDYARSMGTVERCLEINPHYPNALYFKSNLHAIKGEHDAAREALIKAVDAQEHIRAYAFVDEEICLWKAKYYLGLSYAGTREYDEALGWLDRAVEARGGFLEVRLARAAVLEAAGRIVEAERAFREIFLDFRSDVALLRYLSCLVRLGREERVVEVVAGEAEARGEGARMLAYVAAARAAHRLGRADARAFLDRALAIESRPHAGVAIQALDELFLEMGLSAERDALRAWELETPPSCRQPHDFARRSARLIEAERYEEAREVARLGLRVAPDEPHLLLNAALAEARTGEPDAAIARLGALDPYVDLELYGAGAYLRAALQHRAGRAEAALDTLDGLLTWRPGQVDALLLRGRLLRETDRLEAAETAYRDAFALEPMRAAVELAGLYLHQGRLEDAQRVAELALGGAVA